MCSDTGFAGAEVAAWMGFLDTVRDTDADRDGNRSTGGWGNRMVQRRIRFWNE